MNTKSLLLDDSKEEVPIKSVKKKIKKVKNNTNENGITRSQFKKKYGYIPSNLTKKILKFDNHHLDDVVEFLKRNNLHKQTPINNLDKINNICVDCTHCFRSINYCTLFDVNCNLVTSNCRMKDKIIND